MAKVVRGELHVRFDDDVVILAHQQGPLGRSSGYSFARIYAGSECMAGENGEDLVDAVRKTIASPRAAPYEQHGAVILAMLDAGDG